MYLLLYDFCSLVASVAHPTPPFGCFEKLHIAQRQMSFAYLGIIQLRRAEMEFLDQSADVHLLSNCQIDCILDTVVLHWCSVTVQLSVIKRKEVWVKFTTIVTKRYYVYKYTP